MSLLRRRMMMGAKQSSSPLVEVENVSVWGYQVSDDAREYGWTLEKPYHLSFSSIANYKYIHMLTDSPFICANTVDADVNVVSDFNVYIPAIGKYSVGQSVYAPNRDLPAQQAENETSAAATGYPQSEIYDSLGRKWIKIVFAGNDNNQRHKTIFNKSMPVYYCVENDLGKVFPERRWDKKYYLPDIFADSERDISYTNSVFNGLVYDSGRNAYLTHEQNDAPAYYNGTLEGYLIEIPSDAEQVNIRFNSSVGGGWVTFLDSNLNNATSGSGWTNDNALYTITSSMSYMSFRTNTLNDIELKFIFTAEW